MKETHRISPWNKQSEEKLRAYMNEIIGMVLILVLLELSL